MHLVRQEKAEYPELAAVWCLCLLLGCEEHGFLARGSSGRAPFARADLQGNARWPGKRNILHTQLKMRVWHLQGCGNVGIERIENALMFSLKKDLPVAIVSSLEGLSLSLSLHHHPSTAFLVRTEPPICWLGMRAVWCHLVWDLHYAVSHWKAAEPLLLFHLLFGLSCLCSGRNGVALTSSSLW